MARRSLSRPMTLAWEAGVINASTTVFDYGCGQGGDVRRLSAVGVAAAGWDPAHAPGNPKVAADIVNLGYVLNVIEDPSERRDTLRAAWDIAKAVLVVAVRPEWEMESVNGRRFGDGVMTRTGTFQKFFGSEEFAHLIRTTTDREPVVVAPGIAFVFHDPAQAQDYRILAIRTRPSRLRITATEARFEENRELLEPLLNFVESRGRLPREDDASEQLQRIRQVFGSLRAAFGLVQKVTDPDRWNEARKTAEDDLAVYLALAVFRGRPRWSDLSDDLQLDVKALFGNYTAACKRADELLFSLGRADELNRCLASAGVGKLLPDALYLHVSALGQADPLLRLYEGCGRALVGEVPGANVIKLNRIERRVSYLSYPGFDRGAHPALAESLRIDLQTFSMKHRDFSASTNPPVLHRKETMVAADYPGRDKFERLTRSEEQHGLFDDTGHIGNRRQWEDLLAFHGLRIQGHRVTKVQ